MKGCKGEMLGFVLLAILIKNSFGVTIHFKVSARNLQLMDQTAGNPPPDAHAILSERWGKLSEDGKNETFSVQGVGKTETIDNTQNPFWGNEFSVTYNPGTTHYIVAQVQDQDWIFVEDMGSARVHVQAMQQVGTVSETIWNDNTYMGTICFTTTKVE